MTTSIEARARDEIAMELGDEHACIKADTVCNDCADRAVRLVASLKHSRLLAPEPMGREASPTHPDCMIVSGGNRT